MISVFTQVAFSIAAWFVIALICTNLLGLLVRGLSINTKINEIANRDEVIMNYYQEYKYKNKYINIFALALIIFFLISIYSLSNVGMLIAALMIMSARLPDLIWEIRHGRKIQKSDMPLSAIGLLSAILIWASLPVVWYAVYRL